MWLTMANQSEKESRKAVAKETCAAIDISRDLDKKNEKKRVGIACAVDLRRPKIKWRRRTGSGACYLNDLVLGASREFRQIQFQLADAYAELDEKEKELQAKDKEIALLQKEKELRAKDKEIALLQKEKVLRAKEIALLQDLLTMVMAISSNAVAKETYI